jgi:FkbM family methyltransferase
MVDASLQLSNSYTHYMTSLKHRIKYLIGDDLIYLFRDLKDRIHPSAAYLEEQKEHEKRKKFYGQLISPGDLCFDVGANIGNRVSSLLAIGAKVVAFEPQRACVKILRRRFGKNIEIVPEAVGDTQEILDMHISNFSALSSLSSEWIDSVKDARFRLFEWIATEKVHVNTLDQAIKTYGVPAFIKIDVEGFEPKVLKGLSTPVDLISFEYATPEQTGNVVACIKLIADVNHNIEFNYSIGESMQIALDTWISTEEMLRLTEDPAFIGTEFGDVYARTKK